MASANSRSDPFALKGRHIGFLGFGKMGSAIARGLRTRYGSQELKLSACDPAPPASDVVSAVPDLGLAGSPRELEEHCQILILAVKPQDMVTALQDLRGNRLYISIAAGLSTDRLRTLFGSGQNPQISRVMPNISAVVGKGISGIYCPDDDFFSISAAIFSGVGQVVRIKQESLMHAVTAVSGSGPAYGLAMIHALAEGGVQAGLPYETALELARETLLGVAYLLRDTGAHPAVLRNEVASPAGTTIAGLAALEDGGFHGTIMRAVEAAAQRSRELADE
jgi:pyrroline-5-carboxylate reductase